LDFHGVEDLLSKLYTLAQAASNDFEALQNLVDRPAQS
jgi:hypothetical protein